jgi:predicted PurR-regulated permease PerM
MDAASRTSLIVLAVVAAGATLHWLADVLAPFALAVFLWLVIDGFADTIYARVRVGKAGVNRVVALVLALLIVAAAAATTVMVIADSATEFARALDGYRGKIDRMLAAVHDAAREPLGLGSEPPSAADLFAGLNLPAFVGSLAQAARSLVSNGILICIYVAFLFAAERAFARKADAIFTRAGELRQARETVAAIRYSVEQFVWVQTWTGAIPAAIAFVIMQALGVDNALFWAFLIFLVCYVPTIGPIVATVLPSLFALVQFDEAWRVLAVFLGVAAPLFVMGNIIQPRVQGETLNLNTLVVLLGLAIWERIWGITGMFLSSPLMVAIMVMVAHNKGSHWLAVLMSADGQPLKSRTRKRPATPSDDAPASAGA